MHSWFWAESDLIVEVEVETHMLEQFWFHLTFPINEIQDGWLVEWRQPIKKALNRLYNIWHLSKNRVEFEINVNRLDLDFFINNNLL